MSQPKATRSSSRIASAVPPPQTRTTRAKAAPSQPPPTKKAAAAARKSPVDKGNAPTSKPSSSAKKPIDLASTDAEPIKAFLRIRPDLGPGESSKTPYLTQLSDTAVRMADTTRDIQPNPTRFRPSSVPPASVYTFSHIFAPSTTQSLFFAKTTLPLVQDILQGQNGLLFTYGVTNSGKTYTVQGGNDHGSAGIVPRTLDVIFNSIDGLEGDSKYRPVRLCGVEEAEPIDAPFDFKPDPTITEILGAQMPEPTAADMDCDDTTLKVDRNYEYAIYISYAEVYNEKIYDLLGSISTKQTRTGIPRAAVAGPTLITRQALNLKSSPPSDGSSGKYVDGLKEMRVHSAEQGKALIKLGQLHRTVFGTLANQESSRSHGIVTIKAVRCHRGERNDPSAFQVSRLTLVDLAGSERTKHTQTSGDRLKEAGNINKSLMVLGRCMEVMRSNQRRLATTLGTTDGRMDTRQVKKNLEYVPFTNSKLTQILMDYFVDGGEGGGKAVMIVNVNPYDTGYDENSHVMKFSALAREVHITPTPAPLQKVPPSQGSKLRQVGPMTLRGEDIAPIPPQSRRREVTLSLGGKGGRGASERVIEIIEEEEAKETEDSDLEGTDPLVEELFEYIEDLEMKLFESQRQCALIEKETRRKVLQEAEERMRALEEIYQKRMRTEMELNERKNDAKFELLQRSMFRRGELGSDESAVEELDVEMSLIEDEESEDEDPAPVAKQAKKSRKISIAVPDGEPLEALPSDEEADAELSDNDESTGSQEQDSEDSSEQNPNVENESDDDDDSDPDEDDDDDYYEEDVRERSPTPAPKKKQTPAKKGPPTPQVSGIEHKVADMSLDESDEDIILPSKKSKGKLVFNTDDEDDMNISAPPTAAKKKKRIISKTAVIDEEDIVRASLDYDDGKTIKRRIVKK